MNCDKEMNLNQPKSKVQWWRIGLILVFIVAFGMINFGCQCDCEEASDQYYVKYEINSTHLVGGHANAEIIISAEKKDLTFNIEELTSWETIIGPVQKEFDATLKVTVSNATVLLYTNIYVSKNDSPFALKASDGSNEPRSAVQLSYMINY
ncbi:MAG: hypothetical protein MUC78_14225 [Bacteroidales bacterium]|jgi:hypothetical protein|nr:hypothetical protein [Bacteroidales bacterium]